MTSIEAAFRATTYRVTTPEGGFALRIGVADRAFDDFLGRLPDAPDPSDSPAIRATAGSSAVSTRSGWGILTAYNPGVLLAEHDNRLRQERLRDRLAASGRHFLPACNLADDGAWPPEPSYLVLDVNEQQIVALGREFCQLAVVWGRRGAVPQLLWI